MRRWSRSRTAEVFAQDEGSAALEFIVTGILLLVPLVYLVISLGVVQEQTLGAEAAARHAARAMAQAPDARTATARADAVLRSVREEYGMDELDVSLSCVPAGDCPRSGATLIVTVRATAALPLVPSLAGIDRLTAVPIEASAAQRVSRQWGGG
ncbi:TadE family protein [Microbacterium sp.]|uniref:TadE family protein n=1 Tax=Microbacterium sp. TaxID=51671 RepID=UPI0033402E51